MCRAAADALNIGDPDEEGESLSLFRANGTIVPGTPIEITTGSKHPWVLDTYLRTFSSYVRSGNPVKLCLGYVKKVGGNCVL